MPYRLALKGHNEWRTAQVCCAKGCLRTKDGLICEFHEARNRSCLHLGDSNKSGAVRSIQERRAGTGELKG